MTQVGKAKLDHPALGTAGGASLHSQIESIFTKISDYLPSRWFTYSNVAVSTSTYVEHNLQVPSTDIRVSIYTYSGSTSTKVTDITNNAATWSGTNWLVRARPSFEQTQIEVKVPAINGPYNFYVFINHCPVDDKLPLTGGTLTGALTLAADPTSDLHAATKQYVDTVAQGLDPKASCRVATTANITLSGLQTIDGIGVSSGDRVLVKNQAASSQNGIYLASASTWTRALDNNNILEFPGAFTFVEQGTANGDTGWVCTTNQGAILDATAITWVQFSGAGVLAGDNQSITVTSNVISAKVDTTSGTIGFTSSGLKVNSLSIRNAEIADNAAIAGSKVSPSFSANLFAPFISSPILNATEEVRLAWASEANQPSDGATLYCPDNENIYFKSALNGTSTKLLTGNLDTDSLTVSSTAPLTGLRNRIINGNFSVDQRYNFGGTALTAGTKKFVCDRWWAKPVGAGPTVTATRGSLRLSGASGLSSYVFGTYLESLQCWDLVNKTVTLSFDCVASASVYTNVSVNSPTAANNYAAVNSIYGSAVTVSTVSQRATLTFSAGACSNGLSIELSFNITNLQTTGAYVDISNVQLEVGGKATAFEARPYRFELDQCQLYYFKGDTIASGITQATDTGIDIYATVPQAMRSTQCSVTFDAYTNGVTGNAAQRNLTAKTYTLNNANCYGNQIWVTGTVATGIGALKPCLVRLSNFTADAEITLV